MTDPRKERRSRILPREAGTAPLDVVIGVMAFLAALSLGAVLIVERMTETWQAGLTGRITVQVLPKEGVVPDAAVAAALDVLLADENIARAEPISEAETRALVEPWLGRDTLIAELPLPRLIDAMLRPGASLDVADLEARLKKAVPDTALDDHSRWIGRLLALAGSVVLSAAGVLALIAVATAAAVAFATRAGLAAHHEIVELLHLMGATDSFISGAFERHYLLATLGAAAAGAAGAAVLFLTAGGLEQAGVTAVPFLPPLALAPVELLWLAAVPACAALIAWGTARISVFSALSRIY